MKHSCRLRHVLFYKPFGISIITWINLKFIFKIENDISLHFDLEKFVSSVLLSDRKVNLREADIIPNKHLKNKGQQKLHLLLCRDLLILILSAKVPLVRWVYQKHCYLLNSTQPCLLTLSRNKKSQHNIIRTFFKINQYL